MMEDAIHILYALFGRLLPQRSETAVNNTSSIGTVIFTSLTVMTLQKNVEKRDCVNDCNLVALQTHFERMIAWPCSHFGQVI